MSVLGHLEPAAVFSFFEKICSIPHGSGHTQKLSAYLETFAKEKGLYFRKDTAGNVILKKDGQGAVADHTPVILQGHLDMVCVAEEGYTIDFEKEPLTLLEKDGIITAQGTSLGGDDGIAVAMALAILDSDTIVHPPLEVVLTADEEIGMLGAAALDPFDLSGRTLLNIDSEDEGYLLVSCAGGATVTATLPVKRTETAAPFASTAAVLSVTGLRGGHSGVEIDKGRANAVVLLGRTLEALQNACKESGCSLLIESADGGGKDNAIPAGAAARLRILSPESFGEDFKQALKQTVLQAEQTFHTEFAKTEENLSLTLEFAAADDTDPLPLDAPSTEALIRLLRLIPYGIIKMSEDLPGLVQTSLNPGILKTGEDAVSVVFSVRSSVPSEKAELIGRIRHLLALFGGSVSVTGDYPAWQYRQDSPLRDLMTEVFTKQYQRPPVLQAIHAGVECGIFAEKLPGLDAVSFGPDMKEIHSVRESMDVGSVARTWNYLLEVLKNL